MPLKVGHARFKRLEILGLEVFLLDATMHLQGANGRDQNDAIWRKTRLAAFDVEEFLGAEIRSEPGLGHHVIGKLERRCRGNDRIAAVRNIGEGATVNESGRALERLHKVRRDRLLEQRGHGAVRLQVTRADRFAIARIGNDDVAEALFQIFEILGQAEDGHDFGSDRDVEASFTRITVGDSAEGADDFPQRAVVHVQHATPCDTTRVYSQRIAPIDVIVDQGGEKVVRRRDGVEVAGEMQIDVLHRHHLRIAAAGCTAFHAE